MAKFYSKYNPIMELIFIYSHIRSYDDILKTFESTHKCKYWTISSSTQRFLLSLNQLRIGKLTVQ